MADQNEEQDLDDLDEDEEETEEETEESGESAESEKSKPKVDKRISDLQSLADKEAARANKAEAALAKLNRGQDGDSGGKDPERAALMTELREASLDAVYGEFAELKEFDIDRSLIEGANRAEMRESATQLVALVKSVSTRARNKALRDAGVTAEPAGSRREPPKNYGQMSGEDFEKELARVKSGGEPIW